MNIDINNQSFKQINAYKMRLETLYGYIDYHYEVSPDHPEGLLVDLGAYVYKEYRGQGKLKEMLKILFLSIPEGTTVQMAVINKILVSMFKRLGFKRVKSIEYWGEINSAVEGVITKKLIQSI